MRRRIILRALGLAELFAGVDLRKERSVVFTGDSQRERFNALIRSSFAHARCAGKSESINRCLAATQETEVFRVVGHNACRWIERNKIILRVHQIRNRCRRSRCFLYQASAVGNVWNCDVKKWPDANIGIFNRDVIAKLEAVRT